MTKNIKQALNSAFRKVPIAQEDINKFKEYLTEFLEIINNNSEENHKIKLRDFLLRIHYSPDYCLEVDINNEIDLGIYNGNQDSRVGVIIETKKPNNKKEMITISKDKDKVYINSLDVKSVHQLLLYYLEERVSKKNNDLKYLIITDFYNWFIFDAQTFETEFFNDNKLRDDFEDFKEKRKSGTTKDFFYKNIAPEYIKKKETNLKEKCIYFNLQEYQNIESDNQLIPLYKIGSSTVVMIN